MSDDWNFELPEGWTSEWRGDDRWALYAIALPGELGYVTVDFTNRRFAAGIRGPITPSSQSLTQRKYSHRGWHQKLVNDAVAWARKELGAP